jgi:Esterase FrsA-like
MRPNDLLPFFSPPREWAGDFGSFRSPLLFRDGARVRNPQEWQTRRAEILKDWHHVLGPWPELLSEPRLETLSESRRENLTQRRVRVPFAEGQSAEGWLMIPDGEGRRPAVLVVYYEPETSAGLNPAQLHRDFALQLSRRGFVTLSIGTPGGNAWKPEVRSAQCQPLSYHAYVAANVWAGLTQLPEVDPDRIGVMGHSYGGKWALFAGALWSRFAAVAVSDPGIVFDEKRSNVNYWEPWYLGLDPKNLRPRAGVPSSENPRTGAYKSLVDRGWDLHELHALIAPRPFFVSGGAEDPPSRWAALNHTVAVNALLGYTDRVGMTSRREHTPDPTSNAQLVAFFEMFLKSR